MRSRFRRWCRPAFPHGRPRSTRAAVGMSRPLSEATARRLEMRFVAVLRAGSMGINSAVNSHAMSPAGNWSTDTLTRSAAGSVRRPLKEDGFRKSSSRTWACDRSVNFVITAAICGRLAPDAPAVGATRDETRVDEPAAASHRRRVTSVAPRDSGFEIGSGHYSAERVGCQCGHIAPKPALTWVTCRSEWSARLITKSCRTPPRFDPIRS